MKKLLFLFVCTLIFSACSRFGQFTTSVEELASAWDETTIRVKSLLEKVTIEQANLNRLTDQIPLKTTSALRFGENYLEPSDQLVSKFMGHKSTFDELVENIQDFIGQWQEKDQAVSTLEQQISEGKLPANVLDQIRGLNGFLSGSQKKMADWENQITDISEQCQKTAETIIRLND